MTLTRFIAPFMIGVFTYGWSMAQNLVPNPGFEDHKNCPQQAKQFSFVKNWKSPAGPGSPDYFNKCGASEAGIPKNFAGKQEAYEGSGYAGIDLLDKEDPRFREYIEVKLIKPLKKGKEYKVSFWISLSDNSKYAVNNIGVYFSDKGFKDKKETRYVQPQVSNANPTLLSYKNIWAQVEGSFKAEGGEEYMTIGNFLTEQNVIATEVNGGNGNFKHAYYYIDMVSVAPSVIDLEVDTIMPEIAIEKPPTILKAPVVEEKLEVGKKFVMKNINFASNKTEILPEAYPMLNKLKDMILSNSALKIEVSGHTDNVGTKEYNLKLSEERAKAVQQALVKVGVPQERISCKGYGNDQPVATNDTEEGKELNRRVELLIVGK